uniref:Exocyst complex component Sec6 n=1 Tax=Oryzias latipes TaxID=8090 RepID=A0A3P9KV22_ORYLA
MRIRSDSAANGRRNIPLSPTWIRDKLQRIVGHPSPPPVKEDCLAVTDGSQPPEPAAGNAKFKEFLDGQCFHEASLLLICRENSLIRRTSEEERLQHHAAEMDKLAADRSHLQSLVVQCLQGSLASEGDNSEALRSAVKAIYLEEKQDLLRRQSGCQNLSEWQTLHDSTLRSLVQDRLEDPHSGPAGQRDQSHIQSHIQSMGRQLREDLLLVVRRVKACYPPEAKICQFYATLYHQTLSTTLRDIVDFVLDDQDCSFILRWVNEYFPGIFENPELAGEIDVAALGELLPEMSLQCLEVQHLSKQQAELATFTNRVLEEEVKQWDQGAEPSREEGRCVSHLAYDVIQFVNGMVTAAEKVVRSLQKAQTITYPLLDLMQRYKVHQEEVIKMNKANTKAYMKAHLGCVEQFGDFLQNKTHLFPGTVREDCLCVLADMKQSACNYLLSPVHKVLKPQYQKLGTSDWLKKNAFQKLLDTLEKELQQFQDVPHTCRQELIGRLHQEVTEEYVRRLLRGDLRLKAREQQEMACAVIINNAESLRKLFTKEGSKEVWLEEILIKIAEVLKLQDVPAIQVQVVSLGSTYPDLREAQVSALLKLKANLSKAHRKTIKATLSDALKEGIPGTGSHPFFSNI